MEIEKGCCDKRLARRIYKFTKMETVTLPGGGFCFSQ